MNKRFLARRPRAERTDDDVEPPPASLPGAAAALLSSGSSAWPCASSLTCSGSGPAARSAGCSSKYSRASTSQGGSPQVSAATRRSHAFCKFSMGAASEERAHQRT